MKDYTSTTLSPTLISPRLMTSSIVGFGGSLTSPTKHNLLVTTTPFMENGDLTTTTNLADQCIHTSILPSIRMPLLNVNYKEEINNRINNSGIVLNGSTGSSANASVMSQLSNVNES